MRRRPAIIGGSSTWLQRGSVSRLVVFSLNLVTGIIDNNVRREPQHSADVYVAGTEPAEPEAQRTRGRPGEGESATENVNPRPRRRTRGYCSRSVCVCLWGY